MSGAADVQKAVVQLWDASGLEWEFKKLWTLDERSLADALQDQEGLPGQPWPYCVFEQEPSTTTDRMSGHDKNARHEIRDVPWQFRVHSKPISGAAKRSKAIARDLIDFIMQKFGGHPTVASKDLALDNGSVLLMQYQNDYPVRTGDQEYQWILAYIIRVDVPVAA